MKLKQTDYIICSTMNRTHKKIATSKYISLIRSPPVAAPLVAKLEAAGEEFLENPSGIVHLLGSLHQLQVLLTVTVQGVLVKSSVVEENKWVI